MGVDYYACDSCGEALYEEYVGNCTKCGASLCTSCLINNDIEDRFAYSYGLRYDPNNPELMQKYADEGFSIYDEKGNPYYEEGDIIDDSAIQPKYCPFCSGDQVNEEEVLKYIIEKYNININEEWKELKKKK